MVVSESRQQLELAKKEGEQALLEKERENNSNLKKDSGK